MPVCKLSFIVHGCGDLPPTALKTMVMINLMKGLPDNVIGFDAEGKVTGKDYETVLIPAVEEKLKTHKKISLLYHLGNGFDGFDLAAMMDDTKVGMGHLTAWDKIALVSDHETINMLAKFFGYIIPSQVKVFNNAQLEDAKRWVSQ
jgi:hypothetical protein